MKQRLSFHVTILCIVLAATLATLSTEATTTSLDGRKEYIVYMGDVKKGHSHLDAANDHDNLLSSIIQDDELARTVRINSYGKSFDGFSAHLLPEEAEELRGKKNVVSVFPNTMRKLHTTRSWDFLGISQHTPRNQLESDLIVGMFDTGIDISAPSFNDKGLGPPPSKWKGICQTGVNFTGCNNKVIGARAYNDQGPTTPADMVGHGSHTASTVAGVSVAGASLYGIGEGTARGGVPSARIAVYKVCGRDGCSNSNLMRGFDDAISDGVDIISLSLGGGSSKDYFSDPIAIGSFHAMKNGILTSASAGNDGPWRATVSNVAPWIMTVGASGTDRQFTTPVAFGNRFDIWGNSINTFSTEDKFLPLTSAFLAANPDSGEARLLPGACTETSLLEEKVKGKIVLCNEVVRAPTDSVIHQYGGVGLLQSSTNNGLVNSGGFTYVLPSAIVTFQRYQSILTYINSTRNPTAKISKSISVKVNAPFVGSFSSRGPEQYSKSILKPDLVAPGVNILAGHTKLTPITGDEQDDRFSTWNILSGTSMACPHATAAAVYVKSFHPDWSPAAVKSALMTTATKIVVRENLAEYAYGSGQINPKQAVNPGLVYDMSLEQYIVYLCSLGYSGERLTVVLGESVTCAAPAKFRSLDVANYPSMNVQLDPDTSAGTRRLSAVFLRAVINVGESNSIYKASVTVPEGKKGITIKVVPDTLTFDKVHTVKLFQVTVEGPPVGPKDGVLSGSLVW
ncbi:Subtilisin-like protease SBT4.15, partial [Linum grandiflorum]